MAVEEHRLVASYTLGRRRPNEIGRLPGMSLPWQFTVPQVGFGAAVALFAWFLTLVGAPKLWTFGLALPIALIGGRMMRRVQIDDRNFVQGLSGKLRQLQARRRHPQSKNRAADAISGNVVVGPDYSTWLVFSAEPQAFGTMSTAESRVAAVATVEQFVASISARRWRLMSATRITDPAEITAAMRRTTAAATWQRELQAESARLATKVMARRQFWLWVDIGDTAPRLGVKGLWSRLLRTAGFAPPARSAWIDRDAAAATTAEMVNGAPMDISLRPATEDEIASALDDVAGELVTHTLPEEDWPHLSHAGPCDGSRAVQAGNEGASTWRLGAAEWSEPRPGVAVAVRDAQAVAHMSAVVSGLPTHWWSPGGELLPRLDALGDRWDWVLSANVTEPTLAQARTRNQARQLKGQEAQYSGDDAGVPPELAVASELVEQERQALANQPGRSEYQVVAVISTQLQLRDIQLGDDEYGVLRDRLGRLRGIAAAARFRVTAPSGDQVAARRLWTPTRLSGSPLLRDYRQYVLSDGVAGLGPLLQSNIGDPQGALIGINDDRGTCEPVLFDPTLGPRGESVGGQPSSPAMGVVGKLGSGKSYFTKQGIRITLSAGGQCTVIDRSERGEYVRFAKAIAIAAPEISVTVVDVRDPSSGSIDPMRSQLGAHAAADAAVRLISVVAGIEAQSTVATAIEQAAREHPGNSLREVVEIARRRVPNDQDWDRVGAVMDNVAADRIGGAVFDPSRPPANLDADLVVLWAPGLALSETPDTLGDIAATAVVLGTAFIARGLVFADPDRFAALVLDEAWSLIEDPRVRGLVREGIRDGRKHNAGVWLITQSPGDLTEYPEIGELVGRVALFPVSSDSAAMECCELAGIDPEMGVKVLRGMGRGTMVWRDVFGRVGLVEVWSPADPALAHAMDTTPTAA